MTDSGAVGQLGRIADGLLAVAEAIRATIPAPPVPVEMPPGVTLSPDVLQACERFAFGDRDEMGRNLDRAREAVERGLPAHEIVRMIRQGAVVRRVA